MNARKTKRAARERQEEADMEKEERSPEELEHERHLCNVCGKRSEGPICDDCSERIRMEALWRKKREEQGNAWSPWD
jgi:CDGSH-type Zn-finger protein